MRFLKDRTVAFVAQTPIIEGAALGKEIDSFDFVFRSNLFPITNKADFGKRCDIISSTKDHYGILKKHKVPHVIHYDDIEDESLFTSDREFHLIDARERARIRGWCLYYFGVDIKDATSGLVAWWICNRNQAKKIKMFGFTGYQNKEGVVVNHGEEKHYVDSYVESLGVREFNESVDMTNYDSHNFAAINYVWRQLLSLGLVEFDYFSTKYFE